MDWCIVCVHNLTDNQRKNFFAGDLLIKMGVYEKRRDLLSLFRSMLGNDCDVVMAPDHPWLIDGPDALTASPSGMTAIYLPKANELRNSELLTARFTLSKLALPQTAKHILVLNDLMKDRLGDNLVNNFAFCLHWDERRDLIQLVTEGGTSPRQRKVPNEILRFVQDRFADALQVTRVYRKGSSQEIRGAEQPVRPDGSAQRTVASAFEIESLSPKFLRAKFETGAPSIRSVNRLVARSTSDRFVLDTGIPYPTEQAEYGFAVIDLFPEYRGDPNKLIRAAAFAGWTFVPEERSGDVNAVMKTLLIRGEKRQYR